MIPEYDCYCVKQIILFETEIIIYTPVADIITEGCSALRWSCFSEKPASQLYVLTECSRL